jgi:hypothetical protein
MQLKSIQKLLPEADVVAGSVIVYHNMRHFDLGKYVGEGSVILSPEGEALVNELSEAAEAKVTKRKVKAADPAFADLPDDLLSGASDQ